MCRRRKHYCIVMTVGNENNTITDASKLYKIKIERNEK